jgi:hypothetical protein
MIDAKFVLSYRDIYNFVDDLKILQEFFQNCLYDKKLGN